MYVDLSINQEQGHYLYLVSIRLTDSGTQRVTGPQETKQQKELIIWMVVQMFNWFTKPYRQHKTLGDINWIERQTEKYFQMDMTAIKAQHQQISALAKEAATRGELAGEIYQGLSAIENAKLDANIQGIRALGATQTKRSGYRSMRGRLLKGK